IVLGLLRAGKLIEFVPYPVTLGFTAGIGIVIAVLQIKDLLGLQLSATPQHFLDQLELLAEALPDFHPGDGLTAAASLATLLIWPKLVP
ncbi:SulP family inorganic anion transporter, partial [Escherichia coli]|uniref:SulP family inorganic anion transporter n=1 Tax=Escherichia coli TaxID=562 RepID=UPI0012CC8F23